MSKWRVHCGRGSTLGHFYLHHPGKTPSGWTRFTSWPEAIAEANKRAHTVEVELPKPGDMRLLPSKDLCIEGSSWGAMLFALDEDLYDGEGALLLNNQDLKAAGEYLLAMHYANERNKK